MKKLVKIIYDEKKKKLRATPVDKEGWVRFPNKLRIEGAVYEVENLMEGKSGSWIATGEIKEVKNVRAIGRKSKKKSIKAKAA